MRYLKTYNQANEGILSNFKKMLKSKVSNFIDSLKKLDDEKRKLKLLNYKIDKVKEKYVEVFRRFLKDDSRIEYDAIYKDLRRLFDYYTELTGEKHPYDNEKYIKKADFKYFEYPEMASMVENINEKMNYDWLDEVIESIPDSDVTCESVRWEKFGDTYVFIEGWSDKCFSNYDLDTREDKVEWAKNNYVYRLEDLLNYPQYKFLDGYELVDHVFIPFPDNWINYASSIGVYKKKD